MNARHSGAGLALASLLAVVVAPACTLPVAPESDIGQTAEAITNGTPVAIDRYGSAMLWQCPAGAASCCPNGPSSCSRTTGAFKGGCSGTMVADQWMLTAGHCVNTDEHTSGGGTPLPASGIVAISSDRASMATSDAIFLNPSYDVALVHLTASIKNVYGQVLTTPIYTGASTDFIGKSLYCQGFGDNVAGAGYGTLRSASLAVNNATTGWLALDENAAGQVLSPGDSGTACFVPPPRFQPRPPLPSAIVGVQSLEFPSSDNLVGADGFAGWASCTVNGGIWFGTFCMPTFRIPR